MTDWISWVATIATIIAACMTAANLGSRVTGYGFAVFTLGASCWLADGILSHQPALAWTNAVLLVLDVFGVWRWLGWQARVEEGARSAAAASESTPGESLFPASLLSRAPVRCGNAEIGTCVDAMTSCGSGRIAYVVVSEGGMAGVGETLRRLPWNNAHVEGEEVVANLNLDHFRKLETLAKDDWPSR